MAAGSSIAARLETHRRAEHSGSKAVLVAIAIPIFNSQLEKGRDSVTVSNVRSAYGEVAAEYLSATKSSGTWNQPVNTDITIADGTNSGEVAVTINNVVVKGTDATSGKALSGLEVDLPLKTALTDAQCQALNVVSNMAGASGKVKITFTFNSTDSLPDVTNIVAAS